MKTNLFREHFRARKVTTGKKVYHRFHGFTSSAVVKSLNGVKDYRFSSVLRLMREDDTTEQQLIRLLQMIRSGDPFSKAARVALAQATYNV